MSMRVYQVKNMLCNCSSAMAVLAMVLVAAVTASAGEENPPKVAVKIVDPYPINNKILIGGAGDHIDFHAVVTPADTGIYTWSYAKDLSWKPNGKTNAANTTSEDLKDPFPDAKDTVKLKVQFDSSDGKGSSSDERPLNYVAPEHFKITDSNPPPVGSQRITTATSKVDVTVYDYTITYAILDQYKDVLSATTATFPSSDHVQTKEGLDWTSPPGVPPPTIRSNYENRDAGRQLDTINVTFRPILLINKKTGRFDPALADVVTVTHHVWKARAKNSSGNEYSTTDNQLSVKMTDISADGQSATITTTYTVTTP